MPFIPKPTKEEVELYLKKWDELENYYLQEKAIDKLFLNFCPLNNNISDILLKVSVLNDFYSTNIFSVFPVAKHILSLKIDDRLKSKDILLVEDIKKVIISGKVRNFYSFATKYCSHHNPLDFPIYDSYVEKILVHFKKEDNFYDFRNEDLKNYKIFKEVLEKFRSFYNLSEFNLKEIDRYLWQLGKYFYLKNYKRKSVS